MSHSSSLDVSLLRADAESRSRPGSRPRTARHSTSTSLASLPHDPEDFINPGATINEENAELLTELLHPHHHAVEETLVEASHEQGAQEEAAEAEGWQKLPWWQKPSPWWFLAYVPFAAIAMTITAAAKIELFTYLVCQAHKPVYNPDQGGDDELLLSIASHVVSNFAEPSQRICAQDPVVQAAVAKLTVIMTTTMGILTCMTTAWWGSLSDRYGRTRVLGCAVVGVLVMDMNFLAVFWFYNYMPGGYWFLVLGPLTEGLLGGQALIGATVHAYISDCTPPALRSGLFSLYLGLMFTGVGVGPAVGGLIIRFTGNFIIVFYISAAIHFVYALSVWFVIPESISRSDMQEARIRHKSMDEEWHAAHAHGGILVFIKRLFSFLTPLSLFLPTDAVHTAKGRRRDWNLLFVVASYGFTVSLMGLYLYIIQYLTGVYGWNTEEVGYWFSSLGAARAIFLTLILPGIIRLGKPKAPPPIQLPTEPDEPLTSATGAAAATSHPHPPSQRQHHHRSSTKFDLALARASLAVDTVVYVLILISPNALVFAASTTLGALGMGFGPAVHSVALTLYNQRGGKDSGKLFGAMSVVQAMCSQVFGPFVYGLTYAKTVGTFPKAIFVLACCAISISFVLMALVRLPDDGPGISQDVEEQVAGEDGVAEADAGAAGLGIGREETLVDLPEPLIILDDENRGRKVLKP